MLFLMFAQRSCKSCKTILHNRYGHRFDGFSKKIAAAQLNKLPFTTQSANFYSVQLLTDVQWAHKNVWFHTTIMFYMQAVKQVCRCRTRPIFNCAARISFVEGPWVPQVILFLAMFRKCLPSILYTNHLSHDIVNIA